MNSKKMILKLNTFSKYTFLISYLPTIYYAFFPGKIVLVSIMCFYPLILGMFFFKKSFFRFFKENTYLGLFIFYNIIIVVRGIMNIESERDLIHLVYYSVPALLILPISIMFGSKKNLLSSILNVCWKIGIPITFILLFFRSNSGPHGFAHILSPIYLFIFFIPYLNRKKIIIILSLLVISVFSDFSNRANILNIFVALLITTTYYFRRYGPVFSFIKFSRRFLILSPILFFFLGITGVFNIFTIGEQMGKFTISQSNKTQDVFVDSRTRLYVDVIPYLWKENALIFGLGGVGKTTTHLTDDSHILGSETDYQEIYKEGRLATETGMLNFIQWGGIVGLFIYYFVFVKASLVAMYESKNWFMVMISLWIVFKGIHSFIEDKLILSPSFIFIFVTIGIAFNEKLRILNDKEIRHYLKNLLK